MIRSPLYLSADSIFFNNLTITNTHRFSVSNICQLSASLVGLRNVSIARQTNLGSMHSISSMPNLLLGSAMISVAGKERTLQSYFVELNNWANLGQVHELRSEAVSIIKRWVNMQNIVNNDDRHALALDELNLETLPQLPDNVSVLSVSMNRLGNNLKVLPCGLITLNITANALLELPALPKTLKNLVCSNNKLTRLPDLPEHLVSLFADTNEISTLPALPKRLTHLNIAQNKLISLDDLPETLIYLDAAYNNIAQLPTVLPDALEEIFLSHNALTCLPNSLPRNLQYLSVVNNQLSEIPDSFFIPNATGHIFLENNPLSVAAQQRLLDVTRTAESYGIEIYYSVTQPTDLDLDNTLLCPTFVDSVCNWYADENPGRIRRVWEAIESEAHSQDFAQFLDRLSYTPCFQDGVFRASMLSWLDGLAADNELRAHVFQVAMDALGSCDDRVLLALNTMKKEGLALDICRGKYDHDLKKLMVVAKQMFRLDMLEKIAYEKAAALPDADEVEVYLAYQTKLREELDLPLDIASMSFFDISGVAEIDLEWARQFIKQAEEQQFKKYLANEWAPGQVLLQRFYPSDYQQALDAISLLAQTDFVSRQNNYLKTKKLPNNEHSRMQTTQAILEQIACEVKLPLIDRLLKQANS
jgi:hypothetical protein